MNFFKKFDILYVITLFFLLLSSNSNIIAENNIYWFSIMAFMFLVAFYKRLLGKKELKVIGILSAIYILFVVVRDLFINNLDTEFLLSDIFFLVKYTYLSYIYIVILKEKAIKYLVNVMVHLTLISFFFFFLQIIGFADELAKIPAALNLTMTTDIEGYVNFIIFTFTKGRHDYSNSGFLWEPGAYAVFLVMALLLHFFKNKFTYDSKSYILILGTLTTFSTTGYLGLLMLLFLAYRFRVPKINKLFFFLLPCFIMLIIAVPFLGSKISETYYEDMTDLDRITNLQKYYHKHNAQIPLNRFASMTLIYQTFEEKLILGVSNKYNSIINRKLDVNMSNGIFDFLAKFGLIGFGFLLWCYIKFCRKNLKNNELVIYATLVLLIVGFGEPILYLPLLLIFIFFYLLPFPQPARQNEETNLKNDKLNGG